MSVILPLPEPCPAAASQFPSPGSVLVLPEAPPDHLTRAEVARAFRVCTRTIRRWTRAGILPPPIQVGPAHKPRVLFPREVIAAKLRGEVRHAAS